MSGFVAPFYNYATVITKSDTDNIVRPGNNCPVVGIFVGGAGNIVAVFQGGDTATFTAVPVGTILPVSCIRVNSTNTTASLMLALFQV